MIAVLPPEKRGPDSGGADKARPVKPVKSTKTGSGPSSQSKDTGVTQEAPRRRQTDYDQPLFAPSATLGYLLLVSAVIVGLIVGFFYLWSTVSEMRKLQAELNEVRQFEKRILQKLDVFNQGLQNRLEESDRKIQQLTDMNAELSEQISQIPDQLPTNNYAAPPVADPLAGTVETGSESQAATAPKPRRLSAPKPKKRKTTSQGSSRTVTRKVPRYRRIQQPDGSVKYEKIQ